jgi:hypothetical protein
MFLMDDSLFRLWRSGLVDKEEALGKSNKPTELSEKMAQAEAGKLSDDDGGDDDDDDDDDDEDDAPPARGAKR